MHGKAWEYEYDFLGGEREMFNILSKREKEGWEVLSITGIDEGNDVIWFKRKLHTNGKPPPLENPCSHGIEKHGWNCIYCGGPP